MNAFWISAIVYFLVACKTLYPTSIETLLARPPLQNTVFISVGLLDQIKVKIHFFSNLFVYLFLSVVYLLSIFYFFSDGSESS